jgi:hypothetical protein
VLLALLLSELPVCACAMGCSWRLRAMLAGSPVLPEPVEFVAGGEGKPEPTELTGLGGSGRSGREGTAEGPLCWLGECVLEDEDGALPIYMAERGRSRDFTGGRGGIGRRRAWTVLAGAARCGPRRRAERVKST